jgi:hypothetical protein
MDLLKQANSSRIIDKAVLNKLFYREEQLTIGHAVKNKSQKGAKN